MSGPDKRGTKALVAILVLVALIRLPNFTAPFVLAGDWSFSQFLVYARNYPDLGWFREWTIPCFGLVHDRGVVYGNHPWLSSLLLAVWGWPSNYGEVSYRSLALIFSLFTTVAMFKIAHRMDGKRTAVIASVLFGFAPLSVYMGRAYCMEPVHIAFMLWAYFYYLKWREDGTGFLPCLTFLALAQLSDIYTLFFSLWVFLVWAKGFAEHRAQTGKWFLLAVTPVIVQIGLILIVAQRSLGQHVWERGVSRVGRPWSDWVDPGYWLGTGQMLAWNYAYLLPLIALIGVVWLWKKPPQEEPVSTGLGFLWFYPIIYTLVCSEWMKHHTHLVIFYGPVLAIQSAIFLRRLKQHWQIAIVTVQLGLSLWLNQAHYLQVVPYHVEELKYAQEIRKLKKPGDILIGLPPHIAYYVNHKAAVPYDFFLRSGASDTKVLNQIIRDLVGKDRYRRVILFPAFIQWPGGLKRLDLENVYPQDGPYKIIFSSQRMYIWEQNSVVP